MAVVAGAIGEKRDKALEERVNGTVHPTTNKDYDFQALTLTHLDSLYNFALFLTRNPTETDDLVHETYLRAFRFSHRFQPGTHLRAWLFQIMRNTFLTFYRLRKREVVTVAENGIPEGDRYMFHDAPQVDGYTTEVRTDLERAVRHLPEEFRTAFLLAEVEGMILEDIARVMECPVGTVKSRIFRAKDRLRTLLREYSGEYGGHDRIPAKRAYNGKAIDVFA
ncbi:sigma-70 family RNA polymerase sigma factor [Candidatus Woesearchaeota archaeon]|nr:sigma-70 family RNA polymerase sigma factor [Candidatus Woesearchaeota archaeon]